MIGRVSLFEEMDEWEFSNKILKLKEKLKEEQDEEENIADTDFGKYFTETKLVGCVLSYHNKIRCCILVLLYTIVFIIDLHFTSEEEQGEEIQLLCENRDADIGNVRY